jgi:hypothetical protein
MCVLRPNCYLTKPVQFRAFETLVKGINDFWLTKTKLPQHMQTAQPLPAATS